MTFSISNLKKKNYTIEGFRRLFSFRLIYLLYRLHNLAFNICLYKSFVAISRLGNDTSKYNLSVR